jgi:hypothetical protein
MAAQKRPFTGLLRKPISADDAPAGSLKRAFALPPDRDDILAYVADQVATRVLELDKFFKLNSRSADIWEKRAKALIANQFGVESHDGEWWNRLTWYLAFRYVPGFSIKGTGHRKRGHPVEWDFSRLAQLFSDVEFLRKTAKLTIRNICNKLPKRKGYETRWGKYTGDSLRKAYLEAKKRRGDMFFYYFLHGLESTIPANGIDPIEAAIEKHALKI